MHFLAGARYACLACATRGIARHCASCGATDDVVDLSSESGRRRWLLFRAPGSRIGRRHGWFDPRALASLPPGRRWLWLSSRSAFVGGFAWSLLSDFMPAARHLVALATHMVVAVVIGALAAAVPLVATGVVVFLAIGVAGVAAQILSIAGDVSALVARLGRGRVSERAARIRDGFRRAAQRNVMQAMLDVLEKLFVSQLRIAPAPSEPDETDAVFGTVSGDRSALVLVEERTGTFELSDVADASLEVELRDGERIGVVMTVAFVRVMVPVQPRDGLDDSVRAQLAWTDVEGARLDRAASIRLGSGARVKLRGGVWSEVADGAESAAGYRVAAARRVLTGTLDAPLWVEVAG